MPGQGNENNSTVTTPNPAINGRRVTTWEPDSPDSATSAITQAVGAASMCWENPGGAGEFQSEQALSVVEGLVAWLRGQGIDIT